MGVSILKGSGDGIQLIPGIGVSVLAETKVNQVEVLCEIALFCDGDATVIHAGVSPFDDDGGVDIGAGIGVQPDVSAGAGVFDIEADIGLDAAIMEAGGYSIINNSIGMQAGIQAESPAGVDITGWIGVESNLELVPHNAIMVDAAIGIDAMINASAMVNGVSISSTIGLETDVKAMVGGQASISGTIGMTASVEFIPDGTCRISMPYDQKKRWC
jgi:hypothetical protein